MKAYMLKVFVIDLDEVGADATAQMLEDAHYPNHAISPDVVAV
jgi:hypothetical protein